jgi:hypothetical protein
MPKTKTPFLDSALILIKAAKSDEHIKFIIADAIGRSSVSLSLIDEAEEYCATYAPNAHKEKKKRK